MLPMLGLSLGVDLPCVQPLGLWVPSVGLSSWLLLLLSSPLLSMYLLWTFWMAHPGYLPLPKTYFRCCISPWKSYGLVQTVLTLCGRVPMTLYLAEILWRLSHCKYWSVLVGLGYTVIDKELSAWDLTKVSRNRTDPFSWLPSTVNLIAGSILLISSKNNCLWDCCWMTKVSSTNLSQYLGGGGRLESFSLKMFQVQVCHFRAYWRPHSCAFNLFIKLVLKREVSIVQTEPQKFNDVLYWQYWPVPQGVILFK